MDILGEGMRQIKHAFSGAVYEMDGTGNILVTAKDGRTGRFTGEGVWIEGEVRTCDPHLCVWIAGPSTVSRHVASAQKAGG
ncbi:MAG TPA: hypothetical protein VF855_01680 [Acidimicrobiales bacterium]